MAWEADLLYQKVRAQGLRDGDHNTGFFHTVIRESRQKNAMSLQHTDGTVVRIRHKFVGWPLSTLASYFRNHLSLCMRIYLINNPSMVSADMNNILCVTPNVQEIWML